MTQDELDREITFQCYQRDAQAGTDGLNPHTISEPIAFSEHASKVGCHHDQRNRVDMGAIYAQAVADDAIAADKTDPRRSRKGWLDLDDQGEDRAKMPKVLRCVCCYCKKVIRAGELVGGQPSHGICDACLAEKHPEAVPHA